MATAKPKRISSHPSPSMYHGKIIAVPSAKPMVRGENGKIADDMLETLAIVIYDEMHGAFVATPISWELAQAFHAPALHEALQLVRPQVIPT